MTVAPWLMTSGLHGTGTCRMGREGWGVVDEQCRVHGVEGLRVIDCSMIPTPISGNTNGPAMATAWRAADIILADKRVNARPEEAIVD
jgi:choline dehydrogenase